ncbi:MAG: RNA methyltransferase [Eubacterium sp.]|nr:RNA methyltransferase [Eubacterium sp.]
MGITEVKDIHSPELEIYTSLNEKQVKKIFEPAAGLFICESQRVIERALLAGYEPVSFFVEKQKADEVKALIGERDIPVFTAEYEVMKNLTGYSLTGGVLCAMRRMPLKSVREFIFDKKKIVILDDIENPTNVGAIFRSAAAIGADGVILTEGSADPLYRRATRVSMGSVFLVEWTYMKRESIDEIKRAGFNIFSLALSEKAEYLGEKSYRDIDKKAVVLGNEDRGISDEILAVSDNTVMIPMKNNVDSLNVAAASAVAFWEIIGKN